RARHDGLVEAGGHGGDPEAHLRRHATDTDARAPGREVRDERELYQANRGTGSLGSGLTVAARHDRSAGLASRWIEREPHRAPEAAQQVVERGRVREPLVGARARGEKGLARAAGDADCERGVDALDSADGDRLAVEVGRADRGSEGNRLSRRRLGRVARPGEAAAVEDEWPQQAI